MSARWDGLALHWDGKISPVRYDSSPPKSQAHPGSRPTREGTAPSPLPVSQEPGRGSSTWRVARRHFMAPMRGRFAGERRLWTPARPGPRDLARSAARRRCCPGTSPGTAQPRQDRPIHYHDQPIPGQDRPGPDRTGQTPVSSGPSPATTGPSPAGPA